jgi:class 3 adenylate cyclase
VETKYVRIGDGHVAYRVVGEGPNDLLLFIGEYLPVDALDEEPHYSRVLRRLSSLGRVIVFNRRGIGLSDAFEGPATQEQYVEDGLAVMDAVGSSRALAFGWNVGGPAAIAFAVEHADRSSALIVVNTSARLIAAPDYLIGFPEELMEQTAQQTTAIDPDERGGFDFLQTFAPSVATDERFRRWWDSAGNRGATPARSRQLWRLLLETDVRDLLRDVSVPTVVMHSSLGTTAHGKYIAEHIPGARFVLLPGHDLMWWLDDADAVLDEIETFIGAAARPRRKLATVLFVDVVQSTERAASIGDRKWRDVLETYHGIVQRAVDRYGGTRVGTSGDGVLATFEMPADAIAGAQQMTNDVRALNIDIRAGVHTGEIEIVGDDVAGIGVHIAARVMDAAGPGEVLVSRTVSDLVTGSGIGFEDRGEHELKGVPGQWGLFAVKT